jgi:multiple sugar transport system substrate-binding protein
MHITGLPRLGAILAAVAVVVAGCSGAAAPTPSAAGSTPPVATGSPATATGSPATTTASPAGEAVTLNFPYLWGGPEGEALQAVIAKFNSSQTAIVVKGVSSPDFQKQLTDMSAPNGFDISDNFGSTVGSWASTGILEPLDTCLAGYDLADFVPAALKDNQFEGKTYALPIAVHTQLLLYNKKLFTDAGIAAPPKTVTELKDAIAKLTKVEASGDITQLGMRGPDYINLAYVFGGDWFDATGTPTPDNAGNLAAQHFWVDNVVQKYGTDKVQKFESGYGEYASAQNPFYTGSVAMVVDGEWQPIFIGQYAPALEWGVVPVPYPDDQPALAGGGQLTSSMFFIPANAAHKAEACTFLKYLVSPEAMTQFSRALGNLPARTSLLADPAYADIPQFSAWLDSLKSANLKTLASLPITAEYTKDLADAFGLVNTLKQTPEDAMAAVKTKAANYGP